MRNGANRTSKEPHPALPAQQGGKRSFCVTIGLGSNLGNRLGNLVKALAHLARDPRVRLQKISSLYRTEPVLSGAEGPVQAKSLPDFLNAVIQIRTSMMPQELMHCLQRIEARVGRVRAGRGSDRQNSPRTLDLDILEHGRVFVKQDNLVIPHPRMLTRKFVLAPLAEIRPRGILQTGGKSVREVLKSRNVASQRAEPVPNVRLRIKAK